MFWGQDQASRFQMKEEPPGSLCHHPTASWNGCEIEKGWEGDLEKKCAE